MSRVFFGKFDKAKPDQIEKKFYAAGAKGNSWYGGIEQGDYVFPIVNTKVIGLWQVSRYGEVPNNIHKESNEVVIFDEVRSFKEPVPYVQFIKYPYFDLDLNLLNKIAKPTIGCGFFEITFNEAAPEIRDLRFENERNIYIAYSDQELTFLKDLDLVVFIDKTAGLKITNINIYQDGAFHQYGPLQKIYEAKNAPEERYTLKELHTFAKEESTRKKNYLEKVISGLEQDGYFVVSNPVSFYDSVLVGRKKNNHTNQQDPDEPQQGDDEIDEGNIIAELEDYQHYAKLLNFNPNLILYGPPGTGKTYATQRIIEAFEKNQFGAFKSFNEIEKEKRVKFITFHQSYSYEEFIEGIRPQVFEEDTDQQVLQYKVESGILKRIVETASTQSLRNNSNVDLVNEGSRIWKVSLGQRDESHIYEQCKQNNIIAVGWLYGKDLSKGFAKQDFFDKLKAERGGDAPNPSNDANSLNSLVNEMKEGDIVLIYDSPTTIRDVGIIKSEYKFNPNMNYHHTRDVVWLKEFEEPVSIYEQNGQVNLTMKTIYELNRLDISDVQVLVESNNEVEQEEPKDLPYYLVIDEINRGNISKIFGELITLIEKDKRETLSITLPYSNKPFKLPSNLYLIGTMNTADRSIAMLDTALRRRFSFAELEPDSNVFSKAHLDVALKVGAVHLGKLLDAVNGIITERLDRDHRIGHSYFMGVITVDDLFFTWYYKVLPLISEYFYNDYDTIKQVVGTSFFNDTGSIHFLNHRRSGDAPSEFEQALVNIYEGS